MTAVISSRVNRSYLFAPGHNAKLLDRVFTAGADAVILDLEDAVPEDAKGRAREMVAAAIKERAALVRVNPPRTDACAADLDAVAEHGAVFDDGSRVNTHGGTHHLRPSSWAIIAPTSASATK